MAFTRRWLLGPAGLALIVACHGSSVGDASGTSSGESTSTTSSGGASTDPTTSSTAPGPAIVEGECTAVIEDLELSEEVWEALELAPGSAISSQALGAMDSLNLSTASVGSLAGLECAVGLRLLALRSDGSGGNSPHTVQDLSPIVDLPQLSQLTLSYYGRKSSRGATTFGGDPRLSWVAGLPALRYPALDDISALAGLVSLRQLDLFRSSVTDLAPAAVA